MTEGIYEMKQYREPTWAEIHASYAAHMQKLAEQSVLETNKGGNNGNND
jgi:hypothetical protein